jgi:hypothetical protein
VIVVLDAATGASIPNRGSGRRVIERTVPSTLVMVVTPPVDVCLDGRGCIRMNDDAPAIAAREALDFVGGTERPRCVQRCRYRDGVVKVASRSGERLQAAGGVRVANESAHGIEAESMNVSSRVGQSVKQSTGVIGHADRLVRWVGDGVQVTIQIEAERRSLTVRTNDGRRSPGRVPLDPSDHPVAIGHRREKSPSIVTERVQRHVLQRIDCTQVTALAVEHVGFAA